MRALIHFHAAAGYQPQPRLPLLRHFSLLLPPRFPSIAIHRPFPLLVRVHALGTFASNFVDTLFVHLPACMCSRGYRAEGLIRLFKNVSVAFVRSAHSESVPRAPEARGK